MAREELIPVIPKSPTAIIPPEQREIVNREIIKIFYGPSSRVKVVIW